MIYSFTGGADGQYPLYGVILDGQGNLYGTTLGPSPCSAYCGSVFELSHGSNGWILNVLHAFRGKKDGGVIEGGITLDGSGNLYGTTARFGPKGYGTTFELSNSSKGWTLTTLHAFDVDSLANGLTPEGSLVLGGSSTIYGVTLGGGVTNIGAGVFYSLRLNARGKWIEKVLYSFKGGRDGGNPVGLSSDQKGNLYGVSPIYPKWGNVFRFSENESGKWTKKNLYAFGPPSNGNASSPSGGVLVDSNENVFGLASGGNSGGNGSLYELTPQLDGKFVEKLLYSFRGGSDGRAPQGPPITDANGNLFGVTAVGGGSGCNPEEPGCGTVFEITP